MKDDKKTNSTKGEKSCISRYWCFITPIHIKLPWHWHVIFDTNHAFLPHFLSNGCQTPIVAIYSVCCCNVYANMTSYVTTEYILLLVIIHFVV
jgi:hypothetical protein